MKNFRMAIIGVGGRGEGLYRVALKMRKNVEFVAVCDPDDKRLDYIAKEMEDDGRPRPKCYHDYKECIDETNPDCILVATAWEAHLPVSTYAMEKGICRKQAEQELASKERARRRYFKSVTRHWGEAYNYDLTINSTYISPKTAARNIVDYLETVTQEEICPRPTKALERSA